MTAIFTKEYIYNAWSTEKKITHNGIKYRVGKMSYGDYFLEPGIDKGELSDFNTGTIWLEKLQQGSDYVFMTDDPIK
jgi:hypothetical protein